jgi:hypothetical protein
MDSNISAWSTGGAVFTFAALYVLFIAVAAALYIVYTRPSISAGHRPGTAKRPVIHTPQPGVPARGPDAPSTAEGAAASQDEAAE